MSQEGARRRPTLRHPCALVLAREHRNDGSLRLASVPKVKLAGSWRRFRAQADFCVVEGRLLRAVTSVIEAVVAAARKRP